VIVQDGSSARISGTVTIADNVAGAGQPGNGIWVLRNSQLRIGAGVQILNNARHGVEIAQQSNGRFDIGLVISNNVVNGLRVADNSSIFATGISVTGNTGGGMAVDDSTSNVSNSVFTGNGGSDINASFGSRLTLNTNTIGPITCDGTVLSRGSTMCPP
jgi:hypothetical protein